MCRYLAGDALDSDDSDDNDEDDDDDDQPDKFKDSCDDEKEESHQSKLDEMRSMLAKFRTRVRSLQQEQPRQVTPKFGNTNQKPLEQTLVQSQPQREDRSLSISLLASRLQ